MKKIKNYINIKIQERKDKKELAYETSVLSCYAKNYNKEYDMALREALLDPTTVISFKDGSSYTVEVNGVKLWIGNYPYSYGNYYVSEHPKYKERLFPGRTTIELLKKTIDNYELKNYPDIKDLFKNTKKDSKK